LTPSAPGARTRVDGWAKVTGAAQFAADYRPPADIRYAELVTAAIPAGRITAVEVGEAERAAGVVAILTHVNAPRLAPVVDRTYPQTILPLQDDRVRYEGEPVAVVVADRLERAQEAAALVKVRYERSPANVDLAAALPGAYAPPASFEPRSSRVGDVTAGLAAADVVVARNYTTATRHHCAIEPSGTIAEWRGGRLFLHDANQGSIPVRDVVAAALGLPADRVRVSCEYTGGGFGAKSYVWPHQIIAAMTARAVGGAVKLVLTRAQTFTSHGYQAPSRQEVTLGAAADGRLTAIRHISTSTTARYGKHVEMATVGSRALYAAPAIETDHRLAPVDMALPSVMRAPHHGVGMFALEAAMDELAYELGIDPVDLRLRNHADRDPTTGRPFPSKELRACYAEGARRFGWADRPPAPMSLRDGDELVGWGMASALMKTFRLPANARARVDAGGRVTVEAGCAEIGNGARTVLGQLAAEALGCDPAQVTVRLGDTVLPEGWLTAGSATTLSTGSAVDAAARSLRARLSSMAGTGVVRLRGDELLVDGRSAINLGELFGRHETTSVTAAGSWAPENDDEVSLHSYGAVFAEVRVHRELGLPRVRRLTGVYSAGRIVNPITARSQMIGGMVWGIGQALLERSVPDPRLGRFIAKDLTGYLVPANADVPDLDVCFIDEYDEAASPIGARGIGELAAVGVSAAIANAVFHATGVRVRDLPITLDTLLPALSISSGRAYSEIGALNAVDGRTG
jgi:xanthine dehydrogenase YagR molybdenum-binding subunit